MNQKKNYRAFIEKAQSGKPVKILYFGGSITAGAGTYPKKGVDSAGNPYDESHYDPELASWRALSYRWLREHYETYPGQFTQINASIGGTGSLFGVMRLDEDVLCHRPDLVFIEYAVNDNGVADLTTGNPDHPYSIFRTLSNIVSRILQVRDDAALFIPLSSYRSPVASSFDPWLAKMQFSADLTGQFCRKAGIPSVSIYDAYYKTPETDSTRVFAGESIPGNIVHPSAYGHKIYADAVCSALSEAFTSSCESVDCADPLPPEMADPSPYSPVFTRAGQLAAGTGLRLIPLNEPSEHTVLHGREVLFCESREFVLRFPFSGAVIGGCFDLSRACRMEISVDGRLLGTWTVRCKTPGNFTGERYCVFAGDLQANQPHVLEMRPAPEQDLEEGAVFGWGVRAFFSDRPGQ